jgi:hypothetical protein
MIKIKLAATRRRAFLEMSWRIGKTFAHFLEGHLTGLISRLQPVVPNDSFKRTFRADPSVQRWAVQPDDSTGF